MPEYFPHFNRKSEDYDSGHLTARPRRALIHPPWQRHARSAPPPFHLVMDINRRMRMYPLSSLTQMKPRRRRTAAVREEEPRGLHRLSEFGLSYAESLLGPHAVCRVRPELQLPEASARLLTLSCHRKCCSFHFQFVKVQRSETQLRAEEVE
ncbi:unnamed protein product, partial [Pleuronectes platessa]